MKKILLVLLSVLSLSVVAQNDVKRIAILETVDQNGDVNLGTKVLLRQSITFGINRIPGYEAYNRVNMAQITGEQNFQRTGMVSDAQIKKLGEMTGAAYVLIAEAVNYDATHILVLANLVDVESGRVTNSSIPKVASIDPDKMFEDCAEVAKSLLGMSTTKGNSNAGSSYDHSTNQNFTNTRSSASYGSTQTSENITIDYELDSWPRYADVEYRVISQVSAVANTGWRYLGTTYLEGSTNINITGLTSNNADKIFIEFRFQKRGYKTTSFKSVANSLLEENSIIRTVSLTPDR